MNSSTGRPPPTRLERDLWFEDFSMGQRFVTVARTIDQAEILEFGLRYSNLPYHTDPAAARDSLYGGLIAPGYLTASIAFGLFVDTGVLRACGMGSPGVDKLRWRLPVRAGDILHVEAEVVAVSPAESVGGRDAIRLAYNAINQAGQTVMTLSSLHFVSRRPGRL